MVYVQDINGKPMMPTTRYGKVRRMLKDKKAVVVSLCPFTIKLTYVTSDYKQEIVLGVDAGTKHVGLSATTKSKELYSSEVILRNDIVDLLSTRRELRKTRRNRLRYRKPRFNNRVKNKRPGWIAPSVRYKVDAHIRVIDNGRRKIIKLLLRFSVLDCLIKCCMIIKYVLFMEGENQVISTSGISAEKTQRMFHTKSLNSLEERGIRLY